MGTSAFDASSDQSVAGVVPRAVAHLFSGIEEARQLHADSEEETNPAPEFKVHAQFVELHNDDMNDLFAGSGNSSQGSIRIHEDEHGNIFLSGKLSCFPLFLLEINDCRVT